MRTAIYIDAFNLYFRMLEKRLGYKWLDLHALCRRLLRPENQLTAINYYTARVSGRLDAQAPARQQVYLDALSTLPEFHAFFGSFLITEKWAGLVEADKPLFKPWPDVVKVIRVEEKGSDVNLAAHLVRDALMGRFDVAAVISNDTDLVEPIRIVAQEVGKPVGLLSPVSNPSSHLRAVASFVRRISVSDLAACQFADPLPGTTIARPASWRAKPSP